MWNPSRAALMCLLLGASMQVPAQASAQSDAFGDPARLDGVTPVAVRAVVDWDQLITETAGGATEEQFYEAVVQTFQANLEEQGVEIDSASERFLVCRVETLYSSGLISFAARVELHEPFGEPGQSAITWHQTWIGAAPVQGMHLLFEIGEQCAEDFAEAWTAANPGA